jgi:hypothetical protein
MKKYTKIIVLSRGVKQSDDGLKKFQNEKENFSYTIEGDPDEFCFKAIKKLFSDGACSDFILVGGEVEIIKDGKKTAFIGNTGKTISKVEVMHHSLVNNYEIPKENLTALKSVSNTKGNAKEIKKYFIEKNITDLNDIGILTNFYHLPRAIKIFKESTGLCFIPISAESVIYDEEYDSIKNFYREQGFKMILGDTIEQDSEIKGIGDMEKGSYSSRFK